MPIGTACPTKQEQAAVKHHLIEFLNVEEAYSAADFEQDALDKLEKLFKIHKAVIMVGGSGLYIDAVCKGFDDIPVAPDTIRQKLNALYARQGIIALQGLLEEKDPTYFQLVDQQNPQRLIRALEVIEASGKPYSSFLSHQAKERPFNTIKIGLNADRELLYERINVRVDQMIEQGLVQEAQSLYPKKHLNALNTVGYKELFEWMDDKITQEEAIASIKQNTRRFAKRQLTWFRRDDTIHWFDPEDLKGMQELIDLKLNSSETPLT